MSNNTNVVNTLESRAKKNDEELEALLAAQQPPQEPVIEDPKEGFSKDNETWAKRYSDLRSHQSRQENQYRKEIDGLKQEIQKLKTTSAAPSTPEEFQAWVNEFPDAVRMMKTLIRSEQGETVSPVTEDLQTRIDRLEYDLRKERASNELRNIHNDAFDIIFDNDFQVWLDDQRATRGRVGQAMWEALNTDDFDASAAGDVISQYKSTTKKIEKKDTRPTTAALTVPSIRTPEPTVKDGKRIYTEEEIEKMSQREFDSLEADIDLAIREGRVMTRRAGAL